MVRALGYFAGGGMRVRAGVVRTWLLGLGIVRELGSVSAAGLVWNWMPGCCMVRAMGSLTGGVIPVRAGVVRANGVRIWLPVLGIVWM
jgi:hypothetical protein